MESFLSIPLFKFSGVDITGLSLTILAVFLIVALVISWLFERLLKRALLAREADVETVRAIRRVVRAVVLVLGLGSGLESIGITLRPGLAAVAGVIEQYLDQHLFTLADTPISFATLLLFAFLIGLTFVVSQLFQAASDRAFRLRGVTDEGTVGTARRLIHYSVLVLGLGIALQNVGIDLSALFAAGALFAVALGFAMQNITQNFISGVILLVERTIKPGDVLFVENKLIRISAMRIRATVGRTLDDEEVIIPNSVLVHNSVTNYTMGDRQVRLRAEVGVVYSSDMKRVREVLQKVGEDLSWRTKTRKPRVLLRRFGSSSVDYELSVWSDDPWRAQQRRSDMHEAIWWALKDANITIAVPQIDVHLDPPLSDSLTNWASRS